MNYHKAILLLIAYFNFSGPLCAMENSTAPKNQPTELMALAPVNPNMSTPPPRLVPPTQHHMMRNVDEECHHRTAGAAVAATGCAGVISFSTALACGAPGYLAIPLICCGLLGVKGIKKACTG